MGILNRIFGKDNTRHAASGQKEMSVNERIDAGLVTYDEIVDDMAEGFIETLIMHFKDIEVRKYDIIDLTETAYKIDVKCRFAKEYDYNLKQTDLMSAWMFNKDERASFRNGRIMIPVYIHTMSIYLTNAIELAMDYEPDHRFNADKFVDFCLTHVNDEGIIEKRKALLKNLDITLPMPSREEILRYMEIVSRLGKSMDKKLPLLNEHCVLIDADGNPLEEDYEQYFPSYDKELAKELLSSGRKTLDEQIEQGDISFDTGINIYVDQAIASAKMFFELTDEAYKNRDFKQEIIRSKRAALALKGAFIHDEANRCSQKLRDTDITMDEFIDMGCKKLGNGKENENFVYYMNLSRYLLSLPRWEQTNLDFYGLIIDQNDNIV